MPTRPPRPCVQPGCHQLSTTGRCAQHPHQRPVDHRPWYHQRADAHPEWRTIRYRILWRDPVCTIRTRCSGAPSTDVDHIVAKADGGTDDPSNLRGACHACHSAKTAAHDRGFGNPKRHNTLATP